MKIIEKSASIQNIESLIENVINKMEEEDLDKRLRNQVNIVCEEILVNIIKYGYQEQPGIIEMEYNISKIDRKIFITFIDKGIYFDPLSVPEPDLNAPIEMRLSSGLGVYIIKKLVDEVNYQRNGDENILSIVKYF